MRTRERSIPDDFRRRRRLSAALAAAILVGAAGPASAQRADNPYVGAQVYVNPEWAVHAAAEPGGSAIASQPTAVWMDRIAAIGGVNGGMGLRDHLDEALRQAGGQPLVFQMVIYNLPGRDCAALASNGELGPTELPRHEQEYIDPIVDILSDPAYAGLRIVAVIEIDSLPNLVTNVTPRPTATAQCDVMRQNGNYVNGIGYALAQLGSLPNVYNYLDAAHHGWIGWDDNFGATADIMAQAATASGSTLANVTGFITNTANYGVLSEPFFTIDDVIDGQSVRENARWIDFNRYVDELSFAQAFRQRLMQAGFSSDIGMLIDTSRNGWGGTARPTGPGPRTTPNDYVDGGRLDRRIHLGNWCNQAGAGIGERPRPAPAPGIDAYVWVKPPGESDGSSSAIPNDEGKGFDRMCDPTYTGNPRNNNNLSGALPDAPLSGHWFPAQFQELLRNAFPPIADLPPPTGVPGTPGLAVQYRAGNTSAGDNQLGPHYDIVNTGTTAVALSEVTIRYWYTVDGERPQNLWCDWAARGCNNLTSRFVSLSPARPGADTYVEIGFTAAMGSLTPGQSTGEIQTRVSKDSWTSYDESDDYSFDPNRTSFAESDRITLYQNGTLVWGVEPGSSALQPDPESAGATAAGAGGCQAATDVGGGAPAGALLAALAVLWWARWPRRAGRGRRQHRGLAPLGLFALLALPGCVLDEDEEQRSSGPPVLADPGGGVTADGVATSSWQGGLDRAVGACVPGGGGGASKFVGNITTSGMVRPDFVTYWDQITPENEGKWGTVEATRDVMDWAGLDAIHAYAREQGIPFKEHNFVWGSQQPSWIAGLSQSEQRAEVDEWIAAFCARYPDVALIDVVNEPPPHTTPPYMEALGGAGTTGFDWIITAFQMARQHCPNAILVLNDYNVLRFDTDRFIGIVNAVKGSGFIDAIGEQGHGLETQSLAELQTNLEKVLATGLPLYITEYDVDVADDTQQRNVLAQQFTLFWSAPQVRGITLWGYIFGSTWKPNTGLIRDGTPRPALTWLMDFLGR